MGNAKRLRTLEWKNKQLKKSEKEFFDELVKEYKKKKELEEEKKDGTQST